MTLLDRIVTPAFVAFQAHCWFAFSVVTVCGTHAWPWAAGAAAVKEFFVDPNFETGETLSSGLRDFVGYATGIGLALLLFKYPIWR